MARQPTRHDETSAGEGRETPPSRRGRGLTAQEAAQVLGVKVSTLAKWRQRGVGPPYSDSLGRDPRYHPDDIDAFLWGEGVVMNSVEAKQRRRGRRAAATQSAAS